MSPQGQQVATSPEPASPVPGPDAWSFTVLLSASLCVLAGVLLRRRFFARAPFRLRAERASEVSPLHWLILGFAGWWAWMIAAQVAFTALPGAAGPERPAMSALAALAAYGAGVGVIAILARPRLQTIRRAGLAAGPRDLAPAALASALGFPVILAISVIAFFGASWLSSVTGSPPPDRIAHESLRALLEDRGGVSRTLRVGALALQAVLLAPVFEELVYRLCLQSALVAAFRSAWAAIAVASIVFALIHLGSVPPHALPVLVGVGALCGVVFERTGRIGPAILVHALFNAMNLALALLSGPGVEA